MLKKAYRKLLYKYGYGLLSIFPTAYIDSKRGYFNDHNCLIALYVLSKYSDSKLGRWFWKIPMVCTWALSKHWYNGYFTGLLNDAHPNTVSKQYIEDCKAYLYEESPRAFGYSGVDTVKIPDIDQPIEYNDLEEDEFSPDIPMDRKIKYFQDEKHIDPNLLVKTGLGYIAGCIMLEEDPKKLLE